MPRARPYTTADLAPMLKTQIQAIIESNMHLWPTGRKYYPAKDTTKKVMMRVILNEANGFRLLEEDDHSDPLPSVDNSNASENLEETSALEHCAEGQELASPESIACNDDYLHILCDSAGQSPPIELTNEGRGGCFPQSTEQSMAGTSAKYTYAADASAILAHQKSLFGVHPESITQDHLSHQTDCVERRRLPGSTRSSAEAQNSVEDGYHLLPTKHDVNVKSSDAINTLGTVCPPSQNQGYGDDPSQSGEGERLLEYSTSLRLRRRGKEEQDNDDYDDYNHEDKGEKEKDEEMAEEEEEEKEEECFKAIPHAHATVFRHLGAPATATLATQNCRPEQESREYLHPTAQEVFAKNIDPMLYDNSVTNFQSLPLLKAPWTHKQSLPNLSTDLGNFQSGSQSQIADALTGGGEFWTGDALSDLKQTISFRIIDHRDANAPPMRGSLALKSFRVEAIECVKTDELVEALQKSPCSIDGDSRLAIITDGDLEPFVKLPELPSEVAGDCSRETLPLSPGRTLEIHVLKLFGGKSVNRPKSVILREHTTNSLGKRKYTERSTQQSAKRVRQEKSREAGDTSCGRANMMFLEEVSAIFKHIKSISAASSGSEFMKSWHTFAAMKGRRDLPDAEIVKGYQFACDFVKRWEGQTVWIEREGSTRGMRIRKGHLHMVLDRDSSWFTPANKVISILHEIGPHSTRPDEQVLKRVTDTNSAGGHDQLLWFLEERLRLSMQLRQAHPVSISLL